MRNYKVHLKRDMFLKIKTYAVENNSTVDEALDFLLREFISPILFMCCSCNIMITANEGMTLVECPKCHKLLVRMNELEVKN